MGGAQPQQSGYDISETALAVKKSRRDGAIHLARRVLFQIPAESPKSMLRLAPVMGAASSCARNQHRAATSSGLMNRAAAPYG